ncbi:MAG: threonine--tRNA ligase [Candidatus Ratteibacteria bacterium]|jgi:threonyl-tRNA synthetase
MNEKTEDLQPFWHTTSHILAHAVKELYPEVKLGTGPAIENGFYYDFYRPQPFTPEDLRRIEVRMKEIAALNLPVVREEKDRKEAEALLQKNGEKFKLEILSELPDGKITFYRQGEFVDLCAGPHLKSTGKVKALILLSVAASYWRADEKRESMQRIYGISFSGQAALDEYLKRLEEIKERDHRRLGVELDLYSFQEEAGPGFVFWHPKGAAVRRVIEEHLMREQQKRGYQIIYTPHLADQRLWQISGHLDFYRENMFPALEMENQRLQVKPMNCPGHILIYKNRRRSYRELPLRWAELGTVYRLEKSGVLHGLLRVRGFTQDDAHIFCRPEDLNNEVKNAVSFTLDLLRTFGFSEFEIFLSTRPEKFVGSEGNWERATAALKESLESLDVNYQIDPGEGVFYGPKIDIKIKDALGRSWQCSTIQVDFNLPERFGLSFINSEGKEEQPIMIHRALLGSLERFFGVLVEHYKGAFPFWLAPVQVAVLPITEEEFDYAQKVFERLTKDGFRVMIDNSDEKIGKKIRRAEMEKIPFLAILGKREKEAGTVALREHGKGEQGVISSEELLVKFKELCNQTGGAT